MDKNYGRGKIMYAELRGKLEELNEKYDEIENEILDIAAKLPREGCRCDCNSDERKIFRYIHVGNLFTEVYGVCLNCGGYIENGD